MTARARTAHATARCKKSSGTNGASAAAAAGWLLTGAEGAALLDAGRNGAAHRLGSDGSRRDDGCATRGGGQTGHHRDGG